MHREGKNIPKEWETFLKFLADRIAEPTQNHPSVRCWTHTSLANIVQEIRRHKDLPSSFPNTPEILDHLKKIGWAHPIDVGVPSLKKGRSKQFYLLDIGAGHNAVVDPLELLQAYRPDGIICYFSALEYYSLTTQLPTHHHIGIISKPPKTQLSPKIFRHSTHIEELEPSIKKKSFGELLFTYQGIPCYLTKRFTTRLIGFQTRIVGPRTQLHITTLEQTLLDTLHKPFYCGGAPVVFEAWEEGVTRFDEDLLNDYLLEINSGLLLRRVGAIFDLLDYSASNVLKRTLEKGLQLIDQNTSLSSISLLPGIESPSFNSKWQVNTP